MATEGPLAGMLVQEVEPGVMRIIDDGAGHDLDERHPNYRYDMDGITIGRDGSVWIMSTYSRSDNAANANPDGYLLWALGRPGMTGGAPWGDLVPLADGSVLILDGESIIRFDGQTFVPDDGPMQRPLGRGATLWLIEPDELTELIPDGQPVTRPSERLAVVWDGRWQTLSEFGRGIDEGFGRCWVGDGVRCVNERRGSVATFLEGTPLNQVAVAPDGAIWAVGGYSDEHGDNGGLYRIELPT
jgi:hypothetical protein